MVFSSLLFLSLFLPVTLFVYYFSNPAWRNTILVLASLFFYAWGAPRFLFLFLLNIIIDFLLVRLIYQYNQNVLYKKILLITSLILNISLLLYYKYANFFVGEFNKLLLESGYKQIDWISIVLPIGISFFVFHKISYVMDIYRGTEKPLQNVIDFALYISLFPQLIAGPIVRFHEVSTQIKCREHSINRFFEGVWRFSLGLGKKVLIANNLGAIADKTFALPISELSAISSWIGILLYGFQIYFDFSGYSDMAIGLGKMFGFSLPENFNRPYVSKSVTEFWRRWHMSLSRFFKDYVYIPLGGNRCSKTRNLFNLWIVFVLCGFWHGANWTFIVWGIYHGMMLVLDKAFLLDKMKKLPPVISNILTFLLIVIGWVFFRSENIYYAINYLKTMFGFSNLSFTMTSLLYIDNKTLFFVILAVFISFVNIEISFKPFVKLMSSCLIKGLISLFLLVYSASALSTGSFNPFIYFRF